MALSFAGIFYRNALNLGLPALVAPDLGGIDDGDEGLLDPTAGRLTLVAKQTEVALEPLPENLRPLLIDGGLIPHLKKRLSAGAANARRP